MRPGADRVAATAGGFRGSENPGQGSRSPDGGRQRDGVVRRQPCPHAERRRLPARPGEWYAAVAAYSGDTIEQTAELFADDVFATLRTGASLVTSDGQYMRVPATPGVRPARGMVARLGLRQQPGTSRSVDCPLCK